MPTLRRQEYDRLNGTEGVPFNELDTNSVSMFKNNTDISGNVKEQTSMFESGNSYNDNLQSMIEQKKQKEFNQTYGVDIFSNPDYQGSSLAYQRWQPSFAEDSVDAVNINNQRNFYIKEKKDRISKLAKNIGYSTERAIKSQESQRNYEAIMMGGRAGSITNSGLLDGMKLYGEKFLNTMMSDGEVKLSDLSSRYNEIILDKEDEYTAKLKEYIDVEKSKGRARIVNSVQGGWIANIDDKSIINMARDYDMDEFQLLSLKNAVKEKLQNNTPENANIVKNQVTEIFKTKSPTGYDVSGSLVGGSLDENGVFRFGKFFTDSTGDQRRQCGEYVNDALGLKKAGSNGAMGSTYESKKAIAKDVVPSPLGYFVENTGYKYGHTGVVENVSNGGKTIEIVDYNSKGNENIRRDTWDYYGIDKAGQQIWQSRSNGKKHAIGGFGKGNLSVSETETTTEVVRNNYEVVDNYIANSSEPIEEFGGYQTILKSKTGFDDATILAISNEASKSKGFLNASLIDFFNKNNLQLTQEILDSKPVDKIKTAQVLNNLYNSGANGDSLIALNNALNLDREMSMFTKGLAERADEKINQERLDSLNDLYLQKQKLELDKVKEANDFTIASQKIKNDSNTSNANTEIASNNYNIPTDGAVTKIKEVRDYLTKIKNNSKNFDSIINNNVVSSFVDTGLKWLGSNKTTDNIKSLDQDSVDSIAIQLGLPKGSSPSDIEKLLSDLENSWNTPEELYALYKSSKTKMKEVPLAHIEYMAKAGIGGKEVLDIYNDVKKVEKDYSSLTQEELKGIVERVRSGNQSGEDQLIYNEFGYDETSKDELGISDVYKYFPDITGSSSDSGSIEEIQSY